MARKYTKRNTEYWNNLGKGKNTEKENVARFEDIEMADIALANHISVRNSISGATTNSGRTSKERFPNINSGLMPFETNSGIISAREAIELCQKAYYNVSIFRNTIDGMVEFSNLPIHVEMKDKRAKMFIENWLKRVGISKLKKQFFREFYRSGNVPIFKFRGRFEDKHFQGLKSIFRNAKNEVTVGYTILNPSCIGVIYPAPGEKTFVRMLSKFEIEELRKKKTPQSRSKLASLPDDAKRIINLGMSGDVYTEIDKDDLVMIFYNKQDYEDFAVPMGYSVLDDIEWKLSLKDMDKKLSKAVDRIILLITMGDEANGVSKKNYNALKRIMETPSAGRVIIADWTTKAQFITPQLGEMLGPEKYKVVNEDIRSGLQNILMGEEKFANQFIKTKVFLERLKEGQETFIEEFLMPEAEEICDTFGIKEKPKFVFEKINLEDKNVFSRVLTRLGELNFLTPAQTFKAINTGLLPSEEEMIESQREYLKLKDEGLFNPNLGGSSNVGDKNPSNNGRPEGTIGISQETKNVGIQTSASNDLFALSDIKDVIKIADKVMHDATAEVKRITRKKRLTKAQKELVDEISVALMENVEMENWDRELKRAFAEQIPPRPSETSRKIEELAEELDLDTYSAALLYHSKNVKSKAAK